MDPTQTIDESDVSFHLGELFDSYEELENKLERFSKHYLVHFWRRDSRTVSGAYMKTARPISEKLKYYSVKYACIYGGQKFLPRGAGRRQSQSIRTNCPAHIMLRASKDGTKLEVTSVNDDHNHEISEDLFKKLPQERKLSGEIRQEVQDLMSLHIDRRRLKEYVRRRTNKILRSKDLFNIAAANKHKKEIPQERALQLIQKIHDLEKLQSTENGKKAESEDETIHRIKRIKTEHPTSPWGQDELSQEQEIIEGDNDGENSFTQMSQKDDIDPMETAEGEIGPNNEEEILNSAVVIDDSDPSVIVETVNTADGSVFVDDHDFEYVDDLTDAVHDHHSPDPQDLDMDSFPNSVINKISKHQNSSSSTEQLESLSQITVKTSNGDEPEENIWFNQEPGVESCPGSESASPETAKGVTDEVCGSTSEIVLTEDVNQRIFFEQLAALKAEKIKLHWETEMLKVKKEKLKLQMSCFTNEMKKQEMEKEKLQLEIKLLQSKIIQDADKILIYIPEKSTCQCVHNSE